MVVKIPPKDILRGEVIQLGLSRILRLFPPNNVNFNAVHVAGTNGKGTVCFYTAHMLRARGLLVGRFTSPHLVDRWDCINIDGKPVSEGIFKNVERFYRHKNESEQIGASSFEILTATAFDLFNMYKVDVGVVEVGVGGREDATNILPQERVLCSVITQIGLDHQSLLGNTVAEIAEHKAGIIRPTVPCVYDPASPSEAIKQIARSAENARPTPLSWRPHGLAIKQRRLADLDAQKPSGDRRSHNLFSTRSEENIRKDTSDVAWKGPFGDLYTPRGFLKPLNMAAMATQISLQRMRSDFVSLKYLMESANGHQWPGRLQSVSIQPLAKRCNPVLLDGAHNFDSAARLGAFVAHRFRTNQSSMENREAVTWVLAVSAGKDISGMLKKLLRSGDTLITTQFGPVDGMPWVASTGAQDLFEHAEKLGTRLNDASGVASSVREAIELAVQSAEEGPMIIAGSLYLVSDVLRLLRESDKRIDDEPESWWPQWETPVPLDKSLWTPRPGDDIAIDDASAAS